MTQIIATVASHEAPEGHATGLVVLVSDDGRDVDSAPVGIKTRAYGWNVAVSSDRAVTLRGTGRMAAVELRGDDGQRYVRAPLPITLSAGDCVVASPGWT